MRKTPVESMMIMVQIIRFLCGREGGKNRAGREQEREKLRIIEMG
jgi:hypothetical protein